MYTRYIYNAVTELEMNQTDFAHSVPEPIQGNYKTFFVCMCVRLWLLSCCPVERNTWSCNSTSATFSTSNAMYSAGHFSLLIWQTRYLKQIQQCSQYKPFDTILSFVFFFSTIFRLYIQIDTLRKKNAIPLKCDKINKIRENACFKIRLVNWNSTYSDCLSFFIYYEKKMGFSLPER